MKSVLIASTNQMACMAIRAYFDPGYKVLRVSDRDSCLTEFRKKRHEFTFVDVEFLCEQSNGRGPNDYRSQIEVFRQTFPAAEIIVLSSQGMIREAVDAVKAGDSDYLTYPIDRDELMHVIESLDESARLRSELNHLRDSFWEKESLEIVQTISSIMKGVLDKV